MSDITLIDNDGGEHPAHKLILMSRSDHFRSMFRHDMQESRLGRINIDASPGAVQQLRKYLYTDNIDCDTKKDESVMMGLFSLGDLYSLSRLKTLIEAEMKDTLSIDNVAGRLMMSVRHNSPLKKTCTDLIRANLTEIVKTKDWVEVLKDASVMATLITPEKGDGDDANSGNGKSKRARYT